MRSTPLTIGRTFGVALDDGEDFFPQLTAFCEQEGIRSGYIPMLIGGFSSVKLVGACEPIAQPERPVWEHVEVLTVEALGSGTLAWDPQTDQLAPHIHLTVGEKGASARGRTSHLLGGVVQFICELQIVEVLAPAMVRPRVGPYEVPTLQFQPAAPTR
ncbi:PPC domain-containing DNA-binding protein [Streptacidiphilus sp. EB103A]|uniref:PPC domain-containing DNA-binding protein n=1 Tax=Streptacidiphilus sp. EB103A TaxID=3156275 RepID=UPI0035163191